MPGQTWPMHGGRGNMATAAVRHRSSKAATLAECDDGALLEHIRTRPNGDEVRELACELLVGRYESLVRSCVHRYRDTPELVEDLMQVGYVGLLKAINNFD